VVFCLAYMYNSDMNTKKIQIIIGIIAIVLIGFAIKAGFKSAAVTETAQPVDTPATSSISVSIQKGDVTVNGKKIVEKVATISGIKIEPMGPSNFIVSWITDRPVATEIHYGSTPPGPGVMWQLLRDTKLKTVHAVELTSLSPGTTYYEIFSVSAKEQIATTTAPGIFTTGK